MASTKEFITATSVLLQTCQSIYKDTPASQSLSESSVYLTLLQNRSDALVMKVVKKWIELTEEPWVENEDAKTFIALVKKNETPLFSELNLDYMFESPEYDEHRNEIWNAIKRIDLSVKKIMANQASTPAPVTATAAAPTGAAPPPLNFAKLINDFINPSKAQQNGGPPRNNINDLFKGLKEQAPEIIKVVKDAMNNKDPDNPLREVMELMQNPKEAKGDLASIAGLMTGMGMENSAFDDTDGASPEIQEKLGQLSEENNDLKNMVSSLQQQMQEIKEQLQIPQKKKSMKKADSNPEST